MVTTKAEPEAQPALRTLPGDEVRQVLWGYAGRRDLQEVVQAVRAAARGPVARLVAEGGRHSHEWNEQKARLLPVFDEAGITALFMEPRHGGHIEGPKNLALALTAFEMAWVDGGAATCGMAGHLALAPIHERGTEEQKDLYMRRAVPPRPGESRRQWRGAFALTEPIPYVGVNTRAMSGKVRIAEWKDGQEPVLEVEKRGRFITNMDYADFVSAAVDTGDERIKSSCMIILEKDDSGTFDRGPATRKLVHQLSSTTDPIFRLRVPASRIIGGYTIRDGVLIPNYEHGAIIAAVFRRTRITVGLMTAAKLLSAVEPIIRYQRARYRGGATLAPGTPLHDLGLQQKEDALHRLVDIWATGEASAALGFASARFFDEFDGLERAKEERMRGEGLETPRAQLKLFKGVEPRAIEYVKLSGRARTPQQEVRYQDLHGDLMVRFVAQDALANVLCPATKLWNTGHGANMMREAVSLMGGVGITEDCPGFLGQKWMDAQLEATYEGPEAVQRRQLALTMTSEVFLAHMRGWVAELRWIADGRPGTGACTLASAMELWIWSLRHLLGEKDADGKPLYRESRQGVTFPMADALCWLVASRQQILDLRALEEDGPRHPGLARGLSGTIAFLTDLCHVQAARAASEAARVCADLVFGYRRHPGWESAATTCYGAGELDDVEGIMPGLGAGARGCGDVIEEGGGHPVKAGPCVRFPGLDRFEQLRSRLDGCLTGARLAKDRAARALVDVRIPEALDYPA